MPENPCGKLLVYNQGHRGNYVKRGSAVISTFLEKGFYVIAIAMPATKPNNQPLVEIDNFGKVRLRRHDWFKFLDRPIRFFMEPVAAFINYAVKKSSPAEIVMTGISGGGWTTQLYSALDDRIKYSFPVAGSYPFFLRSKPDKSWGYYNDLGDFEQSWPPLYRIANYLDLYVMSASGKGRRQVQIYNQFDSSCYAGVRYKAYEKFVKERVNIIGNGDFSVVLDSTHKKHCLSEFAIEKIIDNLNL